MHQCVVGGLLSVLLSNCSYFTLLCVVGWIAMCERSPQYSHYCIILVYHHDSENRVNPISTLWLLGYASKECPNSPCTHEKGVAVGYASYTCLDPSLCTMKEGYNLF